MSTTRSPPSEISQAFDREAPGYARRWDQSPIVQIWRGRVLATLLGELRAGSEILDLGCGTGSDAVALTAAGHRVTGIDASPGMVARARARGVAAEELPWEAAPARFGPSFDAVLSNFGVLNCVVSLDTFASAIRGLVRPGGVVILVWMSRHCPVDTLSRLARAQRPRRGRATAVVSGLSVPLYWWSAHAVATALSPEFVIVHREAVGLLDPGPDLGGAPGALTRLEPHLARLPLLRDLGDHTMLLARRAAEVSR